MNKYKNKLKEIQSLRLTKEERVSSAIKFLFLSIFSFIFFKYGMIATGEIVELLESSHEAISIAVFIIFGIGIIATSFLLFGKGLEHLTRFLSGIKKQENKRTLQQKLYSH